MVAANHDQLKKWLVDEGLTVVKAHELLARQGVGVPRADLAPLRLGGAGGGPLGRARPRSASRTASPGAELQVDFGRMGLIPDPERGRTRCRAGR